MLLVGILVLFPGISLAATPGGTEIDNTAPAVFKADSNTYATESNRTTTTVNNVAGILLDSHNDGYVQAGKSVDYQHTVTNTGNSTDTIALEAVSSLGLTAEFFASDGTTLLTDTDSDGKIDTGPLASGASLDFILRLTAPADAEPGLVDETTLTATSGINPAATESELHSTTILKAQFWDPLEKTVVPPGQVTQGSILVYTNTFGNSGNVTATNNVITDVLDANLIYIDGSATLPDGLTGVTVTYTPGTRTMTWAIPSIPAGYTGQVSFRARIDPAIPSDTDITNTISITSDQIPAGESSNTVHSTVVEQPLRITKSANKDAAEIGDYVEYTVTVENVSESMTASALTVADTLPQGFRYLKGSTTRDGAKFAEPDRGGDYRWSIGTLAPGESATLTYRAIISIDAPLGNGVNSARVTGLSPGNNNLAAGPATATVKVKEGVLNSKTIILGRVFIDENMDRMPGEDEPGVKGARIYLEDGTYSVTDGEGKFSIYGVEAGEHMLKLDPLTVPEGYSPAPLDSSFAGDGGSRFVSAPYGGPARGDFALVRTKAVEIPEPEKNDIVPEKKRGGLTFGAGFGDAPQPLQKLIRDMPATVGIIEPADGAELKRDWSDIVVRVPEGAGHTLMVNGRSLGEKDIGQTIHETERKIFVYQYVSVKLRPGPNSVVLETGAPGSTAIKEITITAPGPPVKIEVTPDKADIPADGKTYVPFTVRLLDEWGKPSFEERIVTVTTDKGAVTTEDIDPSMPGHQIKVKDGKARFELRSTLETGSEKVTIKLGNALAASADIYFTPALREWIVVGIGNLRVGDRDVSGHVEQITNSDGFEDGVYHEGRLAFFTKGKILGKYLLTAAYDSEKEDRDELFQQVDPDRYYPVYGDSSEIGYEAESQRKLYVKIEKGRSSVMFGDYETGLTENEFTRYDRRFNGLKADMESGPFNLKGFGTYASQTITKDEFQGNGTSGFYFLSKTPVIENSEKIHIEVRDRYHPETVISQTDKARYADYDINYTTGSILFKKPVASFDPDLNPIHIVVVYESNDPGDKYFIYGARAGVKSENGSEAGVTAVVEEKSIKNTELVGMDAKIKLGEKTELKGEVAWSDTLDKGADKAWKIELSSELQDKLNIETYYRNVGTDFDNASMTGSETGTEKYGGKAGYRATEKTDITAESYVQNDKTDRTALNVNTVGVKHKFGDSSIETGYMLLQETKAGEPDAASQVAYAELGSNLTERLSASVRREQVLTAEEIEDYQTKTALKLDYKITEWTKAYLTHEFQEGKEDKTDSTLFGIESKVTDSTTLTSKYLIENAISGARDQASIGLNNQWEIKEGLTLHTTAERIQAIRGDATDNTALTLAAEYLPKEDLKVTGRYELRFAEDEMTNLYNVSATMKFTRSVSLLAKMSLWNDSNPLGTDVLLDTLAGIAYRPLGKESIYLLSTLRYKLDIQGSTVNNDKARSLISSTEASYRINPALTLLGKYAGKYNREELNALGYGSYTDLMLAGVACDITNKWNVSAHAKLMNQYQVKMHSLGYVVKTDYNVMKNFFLGAGYNSSRLDDKDLSGRDYSAHGFFVDMRFKFDEGIF